MGGGSDDSAVGAGGEGLERDGRGVRGRVEGGMFSSLERGEWEGGEAAEVGGCQWCRRDLVWRDVREKKLEKWVVGRHGFVVVGVFGGLESFGGVD